MFRLAIVVASISGILALPQLRSVPSLDGRIVGGEDADIQDYPYQLSLQFLGSHICGAATISSTWALTAAHCLDGTISARLLSVRAGSSTRNSGGVVVSVSETSVHPDYSRSRLDYDIALLRLETALSSESSTPVALPLSGGAPIAGQTSIISGWGATSESGSAATILQVVRVPIVSQVDCRSAYGEAAVTDRMFCAGVLGVGGQDACQGDSGGPVVIAERLVGLVSWGNGCARPDYPGVYTSVPALRDWVEQITGL